MRCPRCGRDVGNSGGRWNRHGMTVDKDDWCPMSKQTLPITGTAAIDYYRRATLVTDLATQIQDTDTGVVWDYLTTVPGDELQRLLMIALAAINVDAPLERIYGWVYDLPAARCAS